MSENIEQTSDVSRVQSTRHLRRGVTGQVVLPAPPPHVAGIARALWSEVYDSVRAGQESGLPMPPGV